VDVKNIEFRLQVFLLFSFPICVMNLIRLMALEGHIVSGYTQNDCDL
jgi:hypothetical protein